MPSTVGVDFDNTVFTVGDILSATDIIKHGTSVPNWPNYAGGFVSYAKGLKLWNVCHNSHTRTGRLNPLPASLSECKWFIETENFGTSSGDSSTAHKYLDLLVEWTTRQKRIAEYDIPLTSTNIALDLLDAVTFNDQKFTGGIDRQGDIT